MGSAPGVHLLADGDDGVQIIELRQVVFSVRCRCRDFLGNGIPIRLTRLEYFKCSDRLSGLQPNSSAMAFCVSQTVSSRTTALTEMASSTERYLKKRNESPILSPLFSRRPFVLFHNALEEEHCVEAKLQRFASTQ